jgi:hypothetical protein
MLVMLMLWNMLIRYTSMPYMFNLVHIFAMIYVLDLILLLIWKLPNSLTSSGFTPSFIVMVRSLCGKLLRLDSITSEGVMTDAWAAAVDVFRVLSRHQCACDLVEEFVCAKVLPSRANQTWFAVKDDERYRARGFKGLGVDVKQAWSKVIHEWSEGCIGGLLNPLRISSVLSEPQRISR